MQGVWSRASADQGHFRLYNLMDYGPKRASPSLESAKLGQGAIVPTINLISYLIYQVNNFMHSSTQLCRGDPIFSVPDTKRSRL